MRRKLANIIWQPCFSHSNIMDSLQFCISNFLSLSLSLSLPLSLSLSPSPQPSIPYPSPKKTSLSHPLSPASLPSSATSNPPPLPIKKRMTFKRASVRLLLTVSNKLLTYLSYVVSIAPLLNRNPLMVEVNSFRVHQLNPVRYIRGHRTRSLDQELIQTLTQQTMPPHPRFPLNHPPLPFPPNLLGRSPANRCSPIALGPRLRQDERRKL